MDSKVIGTGFVVSYVDDFAANYKFYTEVLGLVKSLEMAPAEVFFKIGEKQFGLLLCGGRESRRNNEHMAQASFILCVESASAMLQKLRAAGARVVQDAPIDMNAGDYWFQFFDPAGNMLQILGGK